jgi:hypothetical protein
MIWEVFLFSSLDESQDCGAGFGFCKFPDYLKQITQDLR